MEEVEFLNVDMDLESSSSLTLLARELDEKVIFTRNDVTDSIHYVSCELAGEMGSPEYLLKKYLNLLENISSKASSELTCCSKIVFDIGYQSGHEPRQIRHTISSQVISRLAKINAEIATTLYALPR